MNRRAALLLMTLFLYSSLFSVPFTMVDAQAPSCEFVMALPDDLMGLNPNFEFNFLQYTYYTLVYDTLISYDDDLEPIPWLAESWAVSEDSLQINFTIREGAKWHDGFDVTPADVKFTFEYLQNSPELRWANVHHISDIAIDGQTVVINLIQPDFMAFMLLGMLLIVPEHIRSGIAPDDLRWSDPSNLTLHTGSGPFKFKKRVPGEYVELERFDEWWGPRNPSVGQLPNIDTFRLDVITDPSIRILSMRNGDVDTERYALSGSLAIAVLDAPELDLITGVASIWNYELGFNVDAHGLDDVVLRRAIAHALNRDQLVDFGTLGFGTPTNSVIPYEFYSSYYHPDGAFYEYDVEKANEILDGANYTDKDGDGIREYPGLENDTNLAFELRAISWDEQGVQTGNGIKMQLKEIGIQIEVVPMDPQVFWPGILTIPREYEMKCESWVFFPMPVQARMRMHSENIGDWNSNHNGISNATLDAALDDLAAATPSTVYERIRLVQLYAKENIPYIPLYQQDDIHPIRKEWTNYSRAVGGPFCPLNVRSIIFMYDSSLSNGTTQVQGFDILIIGGTSVGALMAGVTLTYLYMKKRK
ncbi:MAG: ABC transporter substrate-binding protein [Candidatus Thorarchaeota archaeon]|nr:MAG: ABC transporter substrate-binding protein [Candidatus Thorarchaeota archaeon]